jgi:hypothetical protein
MTSSPAYRALVCITTCQRIQYLRRYLPHFARFCAQDPRFALLVSLDGSDHQVARFCEEWDVPLVFSTKREGVGLAKNRVLERFPDFEYYFFLEDDVELVDGSVFPAHVELAQSSGIHHFSLFVRGGARNLIGESLIAGRRVRHCQYGGADFNFFTGEGLRHVGGWHPRFAEYRRFGHTEHSYRFVRSGLAPAPFNVAEELDDRCIWHFHPSVARVSGIPLDADQIAAPERALMNDQLVHVPVQTLSHYYFNDVPFHAIDRLAATLESGDRYPLVTRAERHEALSGYWLWQSQVNGPLARRSFALVAATYNWPSNPAIRHLIKTALRG